MNCRATAGLALMLLLGACATQAPRPAIVQVEETGIGFRDLDSEPAGPLAQFAYLRNAELYLSVSNARGTDYRMVQLGTDSMATRFRKRAPVIAPTELAAEQWMPAQGIHVPVFDTDSWDQLLLAIQVAVTPTDRRFGSVINVLDEQDLFHYYDEIGTLRTVPIVYKPESVKVKRTWRLEEIIADAMPELRQTLWQAAESSEHALINTGDDSPGGFPFVFLDFERKRAFFLRAPPEDWEPAKSSALGTTIEAATHLTASHIRVVFEQPVTALTRLFTLATRTTRGVLDPRGRLPIAPAGIPPVSNKAGMDLGEWEVKLDEMTGTSPTLGRIQLLVDGDEFFPRLIETVSGARQSLQLRTYIFDNDDYALRFADLLRRRSADIDVRVMVDGLGTIAGAAAQPEYQPAGSRSGGSVIEYLQRDSKVSVKVLANPWLTGDHTKSIIVDDRTAFVGGMNIGREYRYEWHDLMVELNGPVVDVLRRDFEKTWVRQRFLGDLQAFFKVVRPVNEAGDDMYPLRVLTTSPENAQILRTQIAAIRASQQRIYIQNAYFTSDAILYELVMARRRGVDVRVILPLRSDFGLIDRANAIAANKMIANGVRVYLYPGMSHLKAAIYDGWACFGSANFDALSLQVNRELNIATSHPPLVQELLQRVFLDDMARSVELTEPFPSDWWDFLTGLIADVL